MQKHESGFTLIELMVAIAVAAIVLTLGVPSFERLIERNQLSANINKLVSTLYFARSEAIRRNQQVKVCHSADGVNCGGAGYENGWIVFLDNDSDNVLDNPGEELILVHEALPQNYTLHVNGNMDAFSYKPNGGSTDLGRFVLCKNNDLTKARTIFIGSGGRTRLAPLNASGIPEESLGTPIPACL